METDNIRNTVLNMLLAVLEEGQLSHYVLKRAMTENAGSSGNRDFLKRLFTGVLEKKVYLDYVLDQFSSLPVRKQKPVIRNILRMSLYQMQFMDSVPVSAAVNEAVKLTRKRGFSNLSGFVNAVLRKADREACNIKLSIWAELSVPEWIYELICRQYGKEDASLYFSDLQKTSTETYIRMNLLRFSEQQVINALRDDGCTVQKDQNCPQAWGLSGFEKLTELRAFREGMILIQDPSSMIAAEGAAALCPSAAYILDVCGAPGGKSLYLAERFPEAEVICRDLTEQKINLIRENVERLNVTNIVPQVYDAVKEDPSMYGKADLLIADLPCSGLGVVRRKPDILSRLKPEDLEKLATLQRDILKTVQKYVRPGGILMFSTCTVNKGENEENAEWFESSFPFALVREEQRLNGRDPFDGFYSAFFRREK